jgi:diadenosine tetraphosphate (Ap4A) HIT family hydrolase
MTNQNIYTHLTAKDRDALSFPAKFMVGNNLLIGEVLDFGCGLGKDVEILGSKGFKIIGYDPYYFPDFPSVKFDTILCFYVLNVLMQEDQSKVLMEVSQLLKPSGKAYFAVRRDLQYEGFRMHKLHQKPTYQCNVKLGYKSVFSNENCEIYEYQHYNQLGGKIITNCPFCNPDSNSELILESATAYAIFDKFPVNQGHALIIPKKHISDYFQLTFKEQSACWFMLNAVKDIIIEKFHPDGFNIGINVQEAAGQTISHVHIHLIPRYKGDVLEPRGGVRSVIPEKRDYLYYI